jgi:hypothetical protein
MDKKIIYDLNRHLPEFVCMPVVMTVYDGALKTIKTFNRRAVRNRIVAAAHYHSMKGLLLKITPFSLSF